ncbi:two-component system chemotaxis sensor kinase CheA [Pullulanibacillus pueri]|uniref:Chemotaxis protein CheA n=1 Tax=Pullulanibacillus pueri TaxID=1437324 RepID=A0A8J2ZVT0_9BACL|nr:chemotaxis protein CheA [Pullulanibacillus pueri]MBM7682498.1 two-component system chemotaxis sensor kinase CheA [Pullulanibacillus pueri]GGH82158.1 chemotaxis protein CheA [Pullulanibacillus pueri]
MDTNQYLDLFLDESREHLQNMNQGLLELEKSHGNLEIINEIFRSAHTLKGMAGSMGFQNMTELTHQLENILDALRNGELTISTGIIDALFAAADHLEEMVDLITDGNGDNVAIHDIMRQLKNAAGLKQDPVGQTLNESTTNGEAENFVATVMQQAKEQGFNVWQVEVVVRKDCMLKAARAYMVVEIVEQMGEIIQTVPATEALENGEYDTSFTLILITHDDEAAVREKILKVSEIDNVVVNEPETNTKEDSKPNNGSPVAEENKQTQTPSTKNKGKASQTHKTIRVSTQRLDELMNLFEELVIDKGRLEEISRTLKHQELEETVEMISRTSGRLQDIILNLRMEPVEQVFNRFPKMVRSVSRELGKKIELEMVGVDTELDRNVIDEIGDPLVHLIRNSMDHGIETPEVRLGKEKSEVGRITLRAFHRGNHVFIEIEDDGAGINRQKITNKAIEKGLLSEEEAMRLPDNEVYHLMFHSGFSTADKISDISGRGVGLDVVKNKIESLGGSVSVDSEEGKGSLFTIQLPLTLSIISTMLVNVHQETYALPLSSIVETALIEEKDLFKTQGQEMLEYRGRVIPFKRLQDVLSVPGQSIQHNKFIPAIIAQSGKAMTAFAVDQFIGQQEIVIKSLGRYLGNVQPVSGATILGNGQVALILDCASMI